MGFTSILIDDRDRTGKKVDNNVRKIAKKTKVIITDLTRKRSSPFSSQFHWRKKLQKSEIHHDLFWVFFDSSTEKYCKQIGIFFLLRHFFHSFFRLWQLVHIVPFRSSYQHHLKFHHRNPQTHLALCSSRGDCLIFLNRCFKVSVGLDFSYHVHLQHHQGFLSYNPQISF